MAKKNRKNQPSFINQMNARAQNANNILDAIKAQSQAQSQAQPQTQAPDPIPYANIPSAPASVLPGSVPGLPTTSPIMNAAIPPKPKPNFHFITDPYWGEALQYHLGVETLNDLANLDDSKVDYFLQHAWPDDKGNTPDRSTVEGWINQAQQSIATSSSIPRFAPNIPTAPYVNRQFRKPRFFSDRPEQDIGGQHYPAQTALERARVSKAVPRNYWNSSSTLETPKYDAQMLLDKLKADMSDAMENLNARVAISRVGGREQKVVRITHRTKRSGENSSFDLSYDPYTGGIRGADSKSGTSIWYVPGEITVTRGDQNDEDSTGEHKFDVKSSYEVTKEMLYAVAQNPKGTSMSKQMQARGAISINRDSATTAQKANLSSTVKFRHADGSEVYSSQTDEYLQSFPNLASRGGDTAIDLTKNMGYTFVSAGVDDNGDELVAAGASAKRHRLTQVNATDRFHRGLGLEEQKTTLPVRYVGQPAPKEGYKMVTGFDLYGMGALSEGTALMDENAGYVSRERSEFIPLTKDQLDQIQEGADTKEMLGFSVGEFYRHTDQMPHTMREGTNLVPGVHRSIPGVPNSDAGSNLFSSVERLDIDRELGGVYAVINQYTDVAEANSKGGGTKAANAPVHTDREGKTPLVVKFTKNGETREIRLDQRMQAPDQRDLLNKLQNTELMEFGDQAIQEGRSGAEVTREGISKYAQQAGAGFVNGMLTFNKEIPGFKKITEEEANALVKDNGTLTGEGVKVLARKAAEKANQGWGYITDESVGVNADRLRAFAGLDDNEDFTIQNGRIIRADGSQATMKSFKDDLGVSHEVYSNIVEKRDAKGNVTYSATYESPFLIKDTLENFTKVFDTGWQLFKPEQMDVIANANPGLYANMMELERLGYIKNDARDLMQSTFANVKDNIRQSLEKRDGIIDISEMGLSKMAEGISAGVEGDVELLRAIADSEHGDKAIRVGDAILPSARVALSNLTRDKYDELVRGLASNFIDTIHNQVHMEGLEAVGAEVGDDIRKAIKYSAFRTVMSGAELVDTQGTHDRAFGYETSRLGGAAHAAPGLMANEVAVSKENIYKMYGINDLDREAQAGARAFIDEQLKAGKLTVNSFQYPQSVLALVAPNLRLVAIEDVREREGMGWLSADGSNFYVSPELSEFHRKDQDGDLIALLFSRRVRRNEDGSFYLTGQYQPEVHPEWISQQALYATEERENLTDAAAMDFGEYKRGTMSATERYIKDDKGKFVVNPMSMWRTFKEVRDGGEGYKGFMHILRGKSFVGEVYNMGLRQEVPFVRAFLNDRLSKRAITEDQYGLHMVAAARLAEQAYQSATKFKSGGLTDKALERLINISKTGKYDWDKGTGFAAGFFNKLTKKPEPLGKDIGALSYEIVSAHLERGLGDKKYETNFAENLKIVGLRPEFADDKDKVAKAKAALMARNAGDIDTKELVRRFGEINEMSTIEMVMGGKDKDAIPLFNSTISKIIRNMMEAFAQGKNPAGGKYLGTAAGNIPVGARAGAAIMESIKAFSNFINPKKTNESGAINSGEAIVSGMQSNPTINRASQEAIQKTLGDGGLRDARSAVELISQSGLVPEAIRTNMATTSYGFNENVTDQQWSNEFVRASAWGGSGMGWSRPSNGNEGSAPMVPDGRTARRIEAERAMQVTTPQAQQEEVELLLNTELGEWSYPPGSVKKDYAGIGQRLHEEFQAMVNARQGVMKEKNSEIRVKNVQRRSAGSIDMMVRTGREDEIAVADFKTMNSNNFKGFLEHMDYQNKYGLQIGLYAEAAPEALNGQNVSREWAYVSPVIQSDDVVSKDQVTPTNARQMASLSKQLFLDRLTEMKSKGEVPYWARGDADREKAWNEQLDESIRMTNETGMPMFAMKVSDGPLALSKGLEGFTGNIDEVLGALAPHDRSVTEASEVTAAKLNESRPAKSIVDSIMGWLNNRQKSSNPKQAAQPTTPKQAAPQSQSANTAGSAPSQNTSSGSSQHSAGTQGGAAPGGGAPGGGGSGNGSNNSNNSGAGSVPPGGTPPGDSNSGSTPPPPNSQEPIRTQMGGDFIAKGPVYNFQSQAPFLTTDDVKSAAEFIPHVEEFRQLMKNIQALGGIQNVPIQTRRRFAELSDEFKGARDAQIRFEKSLQHRTANHDLFEQTFGENTSDFRTFIGSSEMAGEILRQSVAYTSSGLQERDKLETRAVQSPASLEHATDAAKNLSELSEQIKAIAESTKNATEVQKDYVKSIKVVGEAYRTVQTEMARIETKERKGEELSKNEKVFKDIAAKLDASGTFNDIRVLNTTESKLHSGVLRERLSDQEHQDYMADALFSTGKRGAMKRRGLTNEDFQRGVELPFFGEIKDRSTAEVLSGAIRGAQAFTSSGTMFAVRHGAKLVSDSVQRAEKYDQMRFEEGATLASSGFIDIGDFAGLSGEYGAIQRRRGAQYAMDRAMGKAASDAYSPYMSAIAGAGVGIASSLAAASTIGSGALGAGMFAGAIGAAGATAGWWGAGIGAAGMAGAFALPAAAVTGTALLIGTAASNANDWYSQARARKTLDIPGGLGNVAASFAGWIGDQKTWDKSAISTDVLGMIESGLTVNEIRESISTNGAPAPTESQLASLSPELESNSLHPLNTLEDLLALFPKPEPKYGQSNIRIGSVYSEEDIKDMQFSVWKADRMWEGSSDEQAQSAFAALALIDPTMNAGGKIDDTKSNRIVALAKAGMDMSQMFSGTAALAIGMNVGIGNEQAFSDVGSLYSQLMYSPDTPPGYEGLLSQNLTVREAQLQAATSVMSANPQRKALGLNDISLWKALERNNDPVTAFTRSMNDSWQMSYMQMPGSTVTGPLGTAMQSAADAGDARKIYALMAQQDMGSFAASYSLRTGGAYNKSVFENVSTTLASNPALAALGESVSTPLATLLSNSSDAEGTLNSQFDMYNLAKGTAQLISNGINPNDLAAIRMARDGRADTARNRQLYTDEMKDQLESSFDVGKLDREKATGGLEVGIAGLGRIAGRGSLTLNDKQRAFFEQNVEAQSVYANIQNSASTMAIAGDGFYKANAGRYNDIANLTFTDTAAAIRQSQQMAQSGALYQSRLGTALNADVAAGQLGAAATQLAPQQFAQFMAHMGGNQIASSIMAAQGKLGSEWATIDLETGADAYRYGINSTEYGNIQKYAAQHGLTDMLGSQEDMAGGTRGLEMKIRDKNVEMARMQYANQVAQTQMGLMFTNGQNSGLDAQGFSTGGTVASSFNGYKINPGNGMTQWQVEDAMTKIGREKQAFGLQQQGMSLSLGQGQFDLAAKQFYEKFALNQRQFEYNTGYQRTEMGIQRSQNLRQREWQQQDISFQRDQAEVEFGWEQEDFDRNIRYARGRERLDLIRQKNRSVISHSMQMGQMDRQEDRFKEGNKWEDERYKREKERFEKGVEFQKEEMEMQKRHFEEGRGFDKQRLDMQKQAYEKEVGWLKQTQALEDQKRLLDRQHYVIQQDMQIKMAGAAFAAQEAIRKWSEQIQLANEAMAAQNAQNNLNLQTLNNLLPVLKGLGVDLTTLAAAAQLARNNTKAAYQIYGDSSRAPSGVFVPTANADGGLMDASYMRHWVGQHPRDFAAGGYTGDGGKYEAAGIVHRGEYVVPQHGAAVIRGDNGQTTELLKKVVAVLERIEQQGPGRVNATIYTNQNQVATSQLTAKDKAYARIRQ